MNQTDTSSMLTNETDNRNGIEQHTFMDFLSSMQVEKTYMPPIRVLFVGDDQQFNDFVQLYVEKVLQIKNNLKNENDEDGEEMADEFTDSQQNQILKRMRTTTTSLNRKTTTKGVSRGDGNERQKDFKEIGQGLNVDFRCFIVPPFPQDASVVAEDLKRYQENLDKKEMETEYTKLDTEVRKGKVNTLAHYMSIYDNLYCQVIYQNFAKRDKIPSAKKKQE